MQATIKAQAQAEQEYTPVGVSLLDVPVATLQIVQASGVVKDRWLDRALLEPTLAQNADGLWVRRQGTHGQFEVPYIGSEVLLADAELGLVVVLVSYHGAEPAKYGRLGYMVPKGQFYRYYQQAPDGTWAQILWRHLTDPLRSLIISTVQEQGPSWARSPGKLRAEYKPPTKPVTLTTYKVVRVIDGRYFSLYDPTQEYVLGQRLKEPAKPRHGGGFFSYPTLEQGTEYLADCAASIPFHREVATTHLALLEVEIGGKIIDQGTSWRPPTFACCACWTCAPSSAGEVTPADDALYQGTGRNHIAPPWPTWRLLSERSWKNPERSAGRMREPPDRLTERVLQMLNAARTSPMTRDEVMERLMLSLRRNLSYGVRKNQRTPSVEALESDLEAIAHAMVLARTAERFASRASQEGRLIAMHPSSWHPLFAGCPQDGEVRSPT